MTAELPLVKRRRRSMGGAPSPPLPKAPSPLPRPASPSSSSSSPSPRPLPRTGVATPPPHAEGRRRFALNPVDVHTEMNSSLDYQWLEEMEIEDLRELDFIDPLSVQQLAESMADELCWEQPAQEQQAQLDQRQQHLYPTAGFSLLGDISAGGHDSMFSFVDGNSKQLSISARDPKQEGNSPSSLAITKEKTKGGRRESSSAPEHVISERKRREKMHLQFATLASIIPDVTKTDKVSLLGSTIDYVDHLKGRLKALQEEQHHRSNGSTADSPPLDARCCIGSGDGDAEASIKIKADVRGRTVLLRVVCREKKGVLIMVLKELEKHGLSIFNTNVLPLAESSSLNITITAQIEDGSSTAVDLVNNLNYALKAF